MFHDCFVHVLPILHSYIEQEDSGRAIKLLNDDTLLKASMSSIKTQFLIN